MKNKDIHYNISKDEKCTLHPNYPIEYFCLDEKCN